MAPRKELGGELELNFTMGLFSHTSMDREGEWKRRCSLWQAGLESMSAKSGRKKDRRVTTRAFQGFRDDLFAGQPIALNEALRH